MQKGKFIISLDFELEYGIEDKGYLESYKKNILGGRKAIPKILELFQKYEIHATWGVVGMILAENIEEWKRFCPNIKPSYKKMKSIYNYTERLGGNEKKDPYHYGYSLIKQIQSVKDQEIASHTFSHYYCREKGQLGEEFDADLKSAREIALTKINSLPESIILPRNQVNEEYKKILESNNFKVYRGCQKGYIYKPNKNSYFVRGCRLLDAYIGRGKKCTYDIDEIVDNNLYNVRASGFLRPYSKKMFLFENMKVNTIKRGMLYAAKNNKVYHLWWHPHNFGTNICENISNLKKILDYYIFLNRKYDFESINMKEIITEVN